jgi:hypothetical protein
MTISTPPQTLQPIRPAKRYIAAEDLAVITCYYNPCGYRTKRENFEVFWKHLATSGITTIVADCTFGEDEWELTDHNNIVRFHGKDVLWQKERLLNLVIKHLPPQFTKVAWLDCDVLFEAPDWAAQTSALLDRFQVVQPFSTAIRLPPGTCSYEGEGHVYAGFASNYRRSPNLMLSGRFDLHGHTGFAWAARREVLEEHGLYDSCVSGSGDHMMAHAFCGDWDSVCVERIFAGNKTHHRHFIEWSKAAYGAVRGKVAAVPGAVLHLWHGEVENRRYVIRNRELAEFGFDPRTDLCEDESGLWTWADRRDDLRDWAREYYACRREDG